MEKTINNNPIPVKSNVVPVMFCLILIFPSYLKGQIFLCVTVKKSLSTYMLHLDC